MYRIHINIFNSLTLLYNISLVVYFGTKKSFINVQIDKGLQKSIFQERHLRGIEFKHISPLFTVSKLFIIIISCKSFNFFLVFILFRHCLKNPSYNAFLLFCYSSTIFLIIFLTNPYQIRLWIYFELNYTHTNSS